MSIQAKYIHTTIAAKDWQLLAKFYIDVFGCELVLPQLDLSGAAVERGTGIPGMHMLGVHLRLPGCGTDGPTLEIFNYDPLFERSIKTINRAGYSHLAFEVQDMALARAEVLAHGGKTVGEVATTPSGENGRVSWCYMTDPEGNAVELLVFS